MSRSSTTVQNYWTVLATIQGHTTWAGGCTDRQTAVDIATYMQGTNIYDSVCIAEGDQFNDYPHYFPWEVEE